MLKNLPHVNSEGYSAFMQELPAVLRRNGTSKIWSMMDTGSYLEYNESERLPRTWRLQVSVRRHGKGCY